MLPAATLFPRATFRRDLLWLAAGALLSAIVLSCVWVTTPRHPALSDPDFLKAPNNPHHYFLQAASNPYFGQDTPYSFRILTSLLVRYLPFSIPAGFKLINFLAHFGSAVVLILICRAVGLRWLLALMAPIPYLLSAGLATQLKIIWLSDSLTHLFLALSVLSFLHKKDYWTSLFCVLGVLNREQALYFLPVWYLARFGWAITRQSALDCLRVWSAPVIMLLLVCFVWYPQTAWHLLTGIRDAANAAGLDKSLGFMETYMRDFRVAMLNGSGALSRLLSLYTAGCFIGPLLPLFCAGLFKASPFVRRMGVFVLLGWGQLFFAGDVDRLANIVFPFLIPVALLFLQRMTADYARVWIIDCALGILLLLFPTSFIAGVVLLAAALTARFFAAKNDPSRNTAEESPRFSKAAQNPAAVQMPGWVHTGMPLVLLVVVFFLFFLFCVTTRQVRPQPLYSFPATLCPGSSENWQLLYYRDSNAEIIEVNNTEFSPSSKLAVGDPEHTTNFVIPVDTGLTQTLFIQFLAEDIKTGSFCVNRGVLEGVNYSSMRVYPLRIPAHFFSVAFKITPPENAVLFGSCNKKNSIANFRFVMLDISRLAQQSKGGLYMLLPE